MTHARSRRYATVGILLAVFTLRTCCLEKFTPFVHGARADRLRCGNLVVYHCKTSNKVGLHVLVIVRFLLARSAFLLMVTGCEGFLGGARSLLAFAHPEASVTLVASAIPEER